MITFKHLFLIHSDVLLTILKIYEFFTKGIFSMIIYFPNGIQKWQDNMVGPMTKENKKPLKIFPKRFNGKSVLWFTDLPYFPWDITVILSKLCIGIIITLQVNFSLIYVNYARKVRRIGFTNVLAEKRHSWFCRICTQNSDEVRIFSKIMSTKIAILKIFEMF